MSISSCTSASNLSVFQQGLNSGDPVQEQVSAITLKRSQQLDKQNIQALVQSVSTSTPAEAPAAGELGHAVNVYA